ncbi:hypothetical protein [Leucothrix pacifica]|uniref:Uncharacterized protein n=1 Tax=Leucothrix pacifica TaxID=1247513 RepID=A0A317CJV5_9GAMM|nr:hypothetical protein [Leucothrix pacifica]PWQ96612.1 hypothetical protein DKW60_12575 [Leucothrix pacifica]
MEEATAPTLNEFKAACRAEFGFLQEDYGFTEVEPPEEKYANPYEVYFEKSGWRIIVAGYSYGFSAGIDIRDKNGCTVPFFHLVPEGFWEEKRQGLGRGQIGDIRYQALCLKSFGKNFLHNDWSEFQLLQNLEKKWKENNIKAWEEHDRELEMKRAIARAGTAFKQKKYSEAADELLAFQEFLPLSQAKKLAICLKRINANK